MSGTAIAFGLAFIVVGALGFLDALHLFEFRAAFVFPLLVITLGVAVLLSGRPKRPSQPP